MVKTIEELGKVTKATRLDCVFGTRLPMAGCPKGDATVTLGTAAWFVIRRRFGARSAASFPRAIGSGPGRSGASWKANELRSRPRLVSHIGPRGAASERSAFRRCEEIAEAVGSRWETERPGDSDSFAREELDSASRASLALLFYWRIGVLFVGVVL